MRLLKNWWFVTITCALLVALLLALGLPLFVAFLRPLWVRLLCVLVVGAIWGLFAYLRRRRAKQASAAIAAELVPDPADVEGRALGERMRAAITQLRSASGKRRDYLYTRPWYVIIGPPGAGKTTALLNSGLRFPFGDSAAQGVGGTRNLDFWFADEAVLVDTAGRYTSQDSDRQVDSRGWTSFLALLRKHRPLQPINGVIVAIGLDELLAVDCAAIDAHAAAVRRRLAELRKTLEVSAPVYMIFTKADRLAGFAEFFEDLDVEGRRAVLGHTFDYKQGKPIAEVLAQAFDETAQSVADRQAKRLFEEVDPLRRSLLLGFPSQLQSLRSRILRFLDGAFATGAEPTGTLRGFYFTSGIQEGAPLDRILAGMAEIYDRPAAGSPGQGSSGRAYFLNRLLGDVIFPEAGLVAMDPAARMRQRARLVGALTAMAAMILVTFAAWGVSFARNRDFQASLLAGAETARTQFREAGIDLKQVRQSDGDLRAALPGLNSLRALPRGYAARAAGGPPLMMRLGLFQSSLSVEAEESYREALRRVMLPRLMLRLEDYMRGHSGDAMALYEPLKVYLMLGQQGPMDAKAVHRWVTSDWATEVFPGSDSAAERGQLATHLTALLQDRNLASVWADRKPPLDGQLVAHARAAIGTLSLADRAYAVMKQKAATAGPDWEVANVLSQGDAAAFANRDQVLSTRVPYFFTRAGFEKTYTLGLATVQEDLKRDLWVLGGDAATGGVQDEMSNIRPGVAGLYAQDYIAAWEAVIAALQPGDYFRDAAAFGAVTKSPSPLKRVLLELRKNTIFEGGAQAIGRRVVQDRINRSRFGRYAGDATQGRAAGLDAGSEITNYFQPVHDYVGDGKTPGPIDEFVAALKQAGQAVIAARSIGGGGGSEATQAQMASAMASVKTAAAGAPPQLQSFVNSASGGGSAAQVSAAKGAVADAYAQSVLPACQEVAQEHFPFFGAAEADAPAVDVLRVFGMGGTLDAFVQKRLMPLTDTSGPVWRWKPDDPIARTLDPGSPEQFAKAAQIRDLLAGGLPLKVSMAAMGTAVASVEVSNGGATYKFDAANNLPKPLLWSISGGLPQASVVLYGADGKELRRFEAEGPWALFRLMGQADKENAGPQSIRATFGEGTAAATLAVQLPSQRNPFSRGDLWSFRCPATL
ncbi:type VI secretion system membrane subunit TssM [Allosphingosinicella deserti]|uniref:Type VI secretion system membrane subunit TssM n=1 Tax=Allosphingosinicella deserti TaxID=2116704 RepID=A0A2P7QFU4_9SPHN|nr:type VI secretion system membrane subunit TssM [Sphingomonas deserti]PSJ36837.1 type VI secretion system membrane subunit TssM [Sphingomonas deserti]